MAKREELLQAASRVIAEQGVKRLTLDRVAQEAGLSKAGLIHHFPSKEALIEAMNAQVTAQFAHEIEQSYQAEGSYNRAYLNGSLKELNGPDTLNIKNSILAALATNQDLLAPWEEEYSRLKNVMGQENVPSELTAIIRLVSDGLWFAKMFDLEPVDLSEQERIKSYLFHLLEQEESKE
ncbi:TetR/AcrR family transcriptional regulator [Salsuginibacillus kocurii]|uniref:TetR/AcrR family transcriptional regulator n=1 Tax=Salsuginibacillus kocurii TaxID=427078 RepID=UPI00036C0A55|nr:TetR/AcrR family transcriptional regulator [Salsuginibacillus kocurii]